MKSCAEPLEGEVGSNFGIEFSGESESGSKPSSFAYVKQLIFLLTSLLNMA